ncbi:DsbA family protein [Leptolyngbya sp. AN03gr2]|uniref:DsbA family protein n=1 Tax=unclassified Leptolyngbya TaxID=2650499 RepID=UPI003D313DB0
MALSNEPNYLMLPVSDRDHCQGDPTAKITLVQYGDYQCPSCQVAGQIILSIQQQLGEQIRFVFRHFPQVNLHPQAHHAAEAAEAAASQNKFWEMHHHLLHHQSQLADGDLVQYAIALYLDVNQFLAEMTSDYHIARVQADIESGLQSGVIKTPTFFINGLKYSDQQCLETLLETVICAL